MDIIPIEPENSNPPLAARWATAEANCLFSLIARPDNNVAAKEKRMTLLADCTARLNGYGWSGLRNQAIFHAIDRLAATGTPPLAGPVEDELRRIGNTEAAAYVHEHQHDFPTDAETGYWLGQALELGRACAAYIRLNHVMQGLDAGQSMSDVAPIIAEIGEATARAVPPPKSILDLCSSAADLLQRNEPLAEPIIDGGLRRGEVGLWVGATKTMKSWSIMHAHISMAMGGTWFHYPCRRGASLMIDCELAKSTITHRLRHIAALYGEPDTSSIQIVSFRENPTNINELILMLGQVPPRHFDLITIDPVFKLLPPEADENNNAFIASFFARLISMATRLECAILCVHHTSKGLQSGKSVSDLGAGAGAQSRAVDWHCGLREHAEPGCVSLHTLCRSFPPGNPSVWELSPPSITARPDLDPDDLKQPKPRKRTTTAEPVLERPAKPNWMTAAGLLKDDYPHETAWFVAELGLSEKKTISLLKQAAAKKILYQWRPKSYREPVLWAKVPMPLTG